MADPTGIARGDDLLHAAGRYAAGMEQRQTERQGSPARTRRQAELAARLLEITNELVDSLEDSVEVTARRRTRTLSIRVTQLPNGQWSAACAGAVASGRTLGEALAGLGSLLDDYPTLPELPPEVVEFGQRLAAERGSRSA
jgi:hypothetical protein